MYYVQSLRSDSVYCHSGGAEMDSTVNIGSVAAGCSIGGIVAGMALSVLVMLGCKRFRNTKGKRNYTGGK